MNQNSIAILIKIASLEFDKISNPMLATYDLTASQYKVIKFLYSQPSGTARVVDIEKQFAITHPTALGLLDNLKKKGFITKVVNPDDARSKVIALTDKSNEMRAELEGIGEKIEDTLTENLSAKEKEQLLIYLQKLLKLPVEED